MISCCLAPTVLGWIQSSVAISGQHGEKLRRRSSKLGRRAGFFGHGEHHP